MEKKRQTTGSERRKDTGRDKDLAVFSEVSDDKSWNYKH